MELYDIPTLPNREDRYTEIMVDCYNDGEVFGAFDAYLSDAIDYPFEATWRVEDSQDRQDWVTITVLTLSSRGDERKGLLFEAKAKGRKRLVPAHEVYPVEQKGRNATVLGDYREWWPGSLHDDEW
jgi:hypothetical protein